MTRPSFQEIFMDMAVGLSRRSTCSRLQVGCVVASTDHRQVLALGYNGGASGQDNDCESDLPGQCGHLHAEENACISCQAPRSQPKVVYCSHMPCAMCCKRLVNLGGVERVVYRTPYRLTDGLQILARAGIGWSQLEDGGGP